MPNPPLSQVIRDAQGNLVRATDPTQGGNGQLAAQAGQGGTPASPAAAATGGANPQAAAMAGTPNQTSAAPVAPQAPQTSPTPAPVRQAPAAGTTLREADAAAARTPAAPTAAQQKEQADAAHYQSLFGDLGGRVQNLIHSAGFLSSTPATGGLQLTPDAAKLPPAAQAALNAVVANPGDQATVLAAVQAVGGASAADLKKYVGDVASAAAAQAKQQTQTTLTPDMLGKLGFRDPADLATSLGVDQSRLSTMSLADLQTAARDRLASEFSSAAALKQQASDPALGPNERAAARKQLADLGATGVYATEADTARLQKSVADADQVQFNGQQMSVADILSDEKMSTLVKNYVDAPEGSPERAQLDKNEPQLAQWVKSHEAALKEASVKLEGGIHEFDATQSANKKVTDSLSAVGLDQAGVGSIMSQLIPGWKPGMSTAHIDATKFPGLELLMDPSKTPPGFDPTKFGANLKQLAGVSPEAAADLLHLTPAQLQKIGAGDPGGEQFAKYAAYVKNWADASKLDPASPEDAAHILGGSSFADIKTKWDQEVQTKKMGGKTDPWFDQVGDILDSGDADHHMAPPADVAAKLKKKFAHPDPNSFNPASGEAATVLNKGPQVPDSLAARLASTTASGGKIDAATVGAPDLSKTSFADIKNIYDSTKSAQTSDGKQALQQQLMKKSLSDAMASAGLDPAVFEKLGAGNTSGIDVHDFPGLEDKLRQVHAKFGSQILDVLGGDIRVGDYGSLSAALDKATDLVHAKKLQTDKKY